MRQPIFVVSAINPQTSLCKGYARAYSPASDNWIMTKYLENARTFGRYSEAQTVYDHMVQQHSNNKWWIHKIERIDLCDEILQDIDNMNEL